MYHRFARPPCPCLFYCIEVEQGVVVLPRTYHLVSSKANKRTHATTPRHKSSPQRRKTSETPGLRTLSHAVAPDMRDEASNLSHPEPCPRTMAQLCRTAISDTRHPNINDKL